MRIEVGIGDRLDRAVGGVFVRQDQRLDPQPLQLGQDPDAGILQGAGLKKAREPITTPKVVGRNIRPVMSILLLAKLSDAFGLIANVKERRRQCKRSFDFLALSLACLS